MKDIHDRKTRDLATLDRSFAHPVRVIHYESLSDAEKARLDKRFWGYTREKPYLAEALRRSQT